jgi:hypothetical protein
MSKLLIIIGLILAFFILKHLITNRSGSKPVSGKQSANGDTQSLDYKDTVQCDYCGTHIPLANAFKQGEEHYCNEEHYKKEKG